MKKLLIIGLLTAFGCNKAATTEQTTPTPGVEPDPPATETLVEENTYDGALEFLLYLVDLDVDAFQQLCSEAQGNFKADEQFATCMSGNAGFAINVVDGVTIGSSVIVPFDEGQPLATALVADLGEPQFVADFTAGWNLPGFVIVFGPVGNVAWIVVLERTE